MPKAAAASSRKRQAEDYDSDGGFVEDAAPSKKSKSSAKTGFTSASSQHGPQIDENGDQYWEISAKRRVQVSTFGKNHFVNIREFYEAGGKTLPGKKGIALSIEQFNAVVELLPQIETAIKAKVKDAVISRPQYGNTAASKVPNAESADDGETPGDDEDDGVDEDDATREDVADDDQKTGGVSKASKSKLEQFRNKGLKANHEATSSEGED